MSPIKKDPKGLFLLALEFALQTPQRNALGGIETEQFCDDAKASALTSHAGARMTLHRRMAVH